jgi:D-beta-D-heptose 7-phosphate kinase/D-beta-D-heptose 1-phosphate adenosyltransferase
MREMISRKRGMQIIGRMRGQRLGVLGDWMLDRYVWGTANRISPEAAVPVVDFVKESDCLGGAGNLAANLAALGARVEAFGVAGKDEAGLALRRRMRDLKLSANGMLEVANRQTTLKTRIIARQQQVVRVDREERSPLTEEREAILFKRILGALPRLAALVISDYDKGVVTDSLAERVLEACKRSGMPVFIKPKWSRVTKYRDATVVAVNRKEAEFLVTNTLETEDAVMEAGRRLLEHFVCAAVLITRSDKGLSLFEQGQANPFHVHASNQERPIDLGAGVTGRQVFDVTGAGDTVLATMALAAASGASLREAAVLGNAAAGVVVGKLGTATLTREELAGALWE